MKKILAFAGSNSSTSINHKLVSFVASQITDHEVKTIRLADYPLPIFSEDLEKESGYPKSLKELLTEINGVEGVVISVNEHNGGPSAFFKNVLDWLSRIEYKYLVDKKVLLMSASPGKRGALSANEYTKNILPRYDAEVISGFNFPSFHNNFCEEDQKINDPELSETVTKAIATFLKAL